MTETVIEVRSQSEIVERFRAAEQRDMFGFEICEYLSCLDFEHAREFFKSDVNLDEQRTKWTPRTLNQIDDDAKRYLDFWLEKIENERGLSVVRATMHYIAWKWLLGHADADTFPGSVNGGDGGWYQRDAYDYIKKQIDSGEWDALSAKARGEHRADAV